MEKILHKVVPRRVDLTSGCSFEAPERLLMESEARLFRKKRERRSMLSRKRAATTANKKEIISEVAVSN